MQRLSKGKKVSECLLAGCLADGSYRISRILILAQINLFVMHKFMISECPPIIPRCFLFTRKSRNTIYRESKNKGRNNKYDRDIGYFHPPPKFQSKVNRKS